MTIVTCLRPVTLAYTHLLACNKVKRGNIDILTRFYAVGRTMCQSTPMIRKTPYEALSALTIVLWWRGGPFSERQHSKVHQSLCLSWACKQISSSHLKLYNLAKRLTGETKPSPAICHTFCKRQNELGRINLTFKGIWWAPISSFELSLPETAAGDERRVRVKRTNFSYFAYGVTRPRSPKG